MSRCVAYLKLFLPSNTIIEAMPNDDRAMQQWDQEIRRLSVKGSDVAMIFMKAEEVKKKGDSTSGSKKPRITDAYSACYMRFQSIDREELELMISACHVEDRAASEPYNSLSFVLRD